MRTIIAGSREFNDYQLLCDIISKAEKETGIVVTTILSGNAKGADYLGEKYAKENSIPVEKYPAKWGDTQGKPKNQIKTGKFGDYYIRAGFERNQKMADNADALIAINLDTGGTNDMVERAQKAGLLVYEYTPNKSTRNCGRFNFWEDE